MELSYYCNDAFKVCRVKLNDLGLEFGREKKIRRRFMAKTVVSLLLNVEQRRHFAFFYWMQKQYQILNQYQICSLSSQQYLKQFKTRY